MQMNNAILRNSKIVIFDQKKCCGCPSLVFFPIPLDLKQIFFFTSALLLYILLSKNSIYLGDSPSQLVPFLYFPAVFQKHLLPNASVPPQVSLEYLH